MTIYKYVTGTLLNQKLSSEGEIVNYFLNSKYLLPLYIKEIYFYISSKKYWGLFFIAPSILNNLSLYPNRKETFFAHSLFGYLSTIILHPLFNSSTSWLFL